MTQNRQLKTLPMTPYEILQQTQRQRVSDGVIAPLLPDCDSTTRQLVLVWPQLGDFDSLEYANWLQRSPLPPAGLTIRAVGIGDRAAGNKVL
jgi:hypothetical protein